MRWCKIFPDLKEIRRIRELIGWSQIELANKIEEILLNSNLSSNYDIIFVTVLNWFIFYVKISKTNNNIIKNKQFVTFN